MSYKAAASRGDSDGQYCLTRCYMNGIGIERDEVEGMKWCEKAANQDHPIALYYLGDYYLKNDESKHEGYKLKRKSAEKGFSEAQFSLGLQYYYGENVNVDEQEAMKWVHLSANQGDPDGLYLVSRSHHYGKLSYQKDIQKSITCLENNLVEGTVAIEYQLALYYLQDQSDPFNQKKAFQMFTKLNSITEYRDVSYSLGMCYEYGLGVEVNEDKAFSMYLDSSDSGYEPSHYALGRCYEEGIGNSGDIDEAYRLYELAVGEDDIDATMKFIEYHEDKIRIRMTNKGKYEAK